MIRIGGNREEHTVSDLVAEIKEIRRQHPSTEDMNRAFKNTINLSFDPPANVQLPYMAWELTDLGKGAVDIIIKAVSAQLVRPPPKK